MAHQCPTCGTVLAEEDEEKDLRITGPTVEQRVDTAMQSVGIFAREIGERWKRLSKRIDEELGERRRRLLRLRACGERGERCDCE